MDFKSYLKDTAEEINQELDEIFSIWRRQVKKINPALLPLISTFIEACEGGKRLRGTLVKLGYELAGDHLRGVRQVKAQSHLGGEIIKIGAAYEILQTAILAHDDVIDLSPKRRGKPTIYRRLGGDHYGISQTIALGDIGFFKALQIIAQSDFPQKQKNLAITSFTKTMIETCLGQVLDVEIPHLGMREEKDALAVSHLKSARYTYVGPLHLGAILGGSDQNLLGALQEFGDNLGIAFQIQDDILGVFGDEKEIGKSVTSDIEEGKNTLLITEALKRANPAQRKILDRYYGGGNLGDKGNEGARGLENVRQVFKETGTLDYARQQGVKYINLAKTVIPRITKDQRMERLLTEMADFLVERTR